MTLAIAAASLLAWVYLTFFHGRFWCADQWLGSPAAPAEWPAVTAVVPARDEAEVIERSVASLLDQDYPGRFSVVVVDDHSSDGTAELVRSLEAGHPRGDRLRLETAAEMPAGWVGKMWAVATGVEAVSSADNDERYLLLTDADVVHSPANLRRLAAKAEAERLDLVSQMVLLDCGRGWERLLIPAFVYFFQKLYPFPRVNDPRARTAGAAGGCVLVRSTALEEAGGIAAIRGEIIDDCALGKLLKRRGPIWLGLSRSERSVRPYGGLAGVWHMVARTAYAQLRYSPLLLAAIVVGLGLVYLAPPLLVLGWPLHQNTFAALLGAAAWLLMALTFLPTLRLYRCSPLLAAALPVAGLLYLGMTLDSAHRHSRGRGGLWKGRLVRPPKQ